MLNDTRSQKIIFSVFGAILLFVVLSGFCNTGSIESSTVFDVVSIVLSLSFVMIVWKDMREVIAEFRIKWWWIPVVISSALLMAVVVHFFVNELEARSGITSSVRYLYTDTAYPYFFAVLSIALVPAVFEELLFRGVLISQLVKLINRSGAIWVSAFTFAILHLSIVSLLWLLPAGLITGWMRFYTRQLWPGMLFHFIYNFTVITLHSWLDVHYFSM